MPPPEDQRTPWPRLLVCGGKVSAASQRMLLLEEALPCDACGAGEAQCGRNLPIQKKIIGLKKLPRQSSDNARGRTPGQGVP